MDDDNNLARIKFFGIGIPEEGKLATMKNQKEIKRLIRSVEPIALAKAENEINTNENKIVLYLLDGNRTEITSLGQGKVQIAQIINNVPYKQIVSQPELRALLENLSEI